MPHRTCVISTRCATSSTSAWRARAARRWHKAVSTSCPIVRGSTWRAGRRSISSHMSEAIAVTRTARQIWAAPGSSHDRLIGALRIVLPMLIGMLAAFVVFMPLFSGGDVSFVLDKNKVEVAKERLRLQSATYRGEDGKGQPFIMTAGSAVQKSSSEPSVRLTDLAARLQLKDGPADVTAPRGAYDMKGQQVRIDGPVKVVSSGGYTLDTNAAALAQKTRHLRSASAVTGTVPQGQFSGNRLSADLANHVVT